MQFIVYLWVLRNFNSEAQCSIEQNFTVIRGGSRTAATSKMERFVIIVNGFQPLTIITKRSILDVAAALDPPLVIASPKLYLLIPCLKISFLFLLCTLNQRHHLHLSSMNQPRISRTTYCSHQVPYPTYVDGIRKPSKSFKSWVLSNIVL